VTGGTESARRRHELALSVWLGALALVCLLFAAAADAGVGAATNRSTTDRPDDRGGSLVHLIYAVPNDGVDRSLDIDGTVATAWESGNRWLKSQTGGRGLRVDTYDGMPDVTFMRLPRPASEYASSPSPNSLIRSDLQRSGITRGGKIYTVLVDGPAIEKLCGQGGAASPPTASVYLAQSGGCVTSLDAVRAGALGALELMMIHETIHAAGFVPTCAPHFSAGHVTDQQADVMAASGPVYPVSTITLDAGHDDYFEAHIPGCLDLADSPYLDGNTVTINVKVDGAPKAYGSVHSTVSGIACPGARCGWEFDRGSALQLIAAAARGSRFVGWAGGVCSGGNPACTADTAASGSVTATFAPLPRSPAKPKVKKKH
jgi:hypothetical protein